MVLDGFTAWLADDLGVLVHELAALDATNGEVFVIAPARVRATHRHFEAVAEARNRLPAWCRLFVIALDAGELRDAVLTAFRLGGLAAVEPLVAGLDLCLGRGP